MCFILTGKNDRWIVAMEIEKKVSKNMCYTVNEHFVASKLSSFTDTLASISDWLRAVKQPISCNFMNNLCIKRNTRIRSIHQKQAELFI